MKRIYLLAAVFVLFSIAPSFGMKLITNNETDRIVPSRSTMFGAEEYIEESSDYIQQYSSYNRSNQNGIPGYQGQRFEYVYRPILGQNIRTELIGTTWHYPAYYYARPQENSQPPQTNVTKSVQNSKEILSKPYIREAADYYIIDTNGNPNNPIPVGIQ